MENHEEPDPDVMNDIQLSGVDLDRRGRLLAMAVELLKQGLTRGEVKDALEEFCERMDWELCSPNDPIWITHSACQERDRAAEEQRVASQPAPEPDALEVRCFKDMLREPVRWLWEGKIPLGKVTVIYGDARVGKSWLATDIAARVSAGVKFPHEATPLMSGKVMMLNANDHHDSWINTRLMESEGNVDNVTIIGRLKIGGTEEYRRIDLTRDIPAIKKTMQQIGAMRMVVVDCLESLCGKGASKAKLISILADLEDWAMDTGMAILVVSQSTKCDLPVKSAWRIDLDALNENLRVWSSLRVYDGPKPRPLAFTITDAEGFVWGALDDVPDPERLVGGDPAQARSRKLKLQMEWLRRFLLDGPLPARQVMAAANVAGYSASQMKRAKQALQVACYKEQVAKGKWMWDLPPQKRTGSVIGKTHVFGVPPAPAPAPTPVPAPAQAPVAFPMPGDFESPSEWYLRMLEELKSTGMDIGKMSGED